MYVKSEKFPIKREARGIPLAFLASKTPSLFFNISNIDA
jgi:hypothetical protein